MTKEKVKPLKKKTIRLLEKVKATILEEPKRLDMGNWGVVYSEAAKKAALVTFRENVQEYGDDPRYIPSCNTVACISGWAILLDKPKLWRDFVKEAEEAKRKWDDGDGTVDLDDDMRAFDMGMEVLELTKEQAERLFYLYRGGFSYDNHWPKDLSHAYDQARTPKTRAKVTAKRIDFFIKTHGTDDLDYAS